VVIQNTREDQTRAYGMNGPSTDSNEPDSRDRTGRSISSDSFSVLHDPAARTPAHLSAIWRDVPAGQPRSPLSGTWRNAPSCVSGQSLCEEARRYRTALDATAPVGVTVTDTLVLRDWPGTRTTIDVFVQEDTVAVTLPSFTTPAVPKLLPRIVRVELRDVDSERMRATNVEVTGGATVGATTGGTTGGATTGGATVGATVGAAVGALTVIE